MWRKTVPEWLVFFDLKFNIHLFKKLSCYLHLVMLYSSSSGFSLLRHFVCIVLRLLATLFYKYFTIGIILQTFLPKAVKYLWTRFSWVCAIHICLPIIVYIDWDDMSSSRKMLIKMQRATWVPVKQGEVLWLLSSSEAVRICYTHQVCLPHFRGFREVGGALSRTRCAESLQT